MVNNVSLLNSLFTTEEQSAELFRPAHFTHLKHLAVFAVVVEAGSFTKAGARLGMGKSAVSRYVSELEEHVGVSLLRRTTRRLFLTDAGERFHAECARVAGAAVDAMASVETRSHLLGSLHIGATYAFGRYVVLPSLNTFMAQHPELSVELSLNDRFVDLVAHGIDLSFRVGSPGHAPSYVSRRIGQMRYRLYASPRFLEERGPIKTPTQAAKVPWLLTQLGPNPDRWVFKRGKRSWPVRPPSRFRSDSAEVLVHAGELGMGLVGLPDFMSAELEAGGADLQRVLPKHQIEPDIPIYAVYPRRRFISPRVAGFLEHLGAAPW